MYEEGSEVANDAVGSIRASPSCVEDKIMELYTKKCEGLMKTRIQQGLINGSGFEVSTLVVFYFQHRFLTDVETTDVNIINVNIGFQKTDVNIHRTTSIFTKIDVV